VLGKGFQTYRLEILNIEKKHAAIDLMASFLSTLGIILTVKTSSIAVEIFFTFLGMLFVFHSLIEILVDIFNTLTGRNIDHKMRAEISEVLSREFRKLEIMDIDLGKQVQYM